MRILFLILNHVFAVRGVQQQDAVSMQHANMTEMRLEEMLPAERKLLQMMAADKKVAALKRLALETSYVQQVIAGQ